MLPNAAVTVDVNTPAASVAVLAASEKDEVAIVV